MKVLHIIQKQTAKSAGLLRYFTGKQCRNGHLEERLVSNSLCLGCAREANRKHYNDSMREKRRTVDRDRVRQVNRSYWNRNREEIGKKRRDEYTANKEKFQAQKKDSYLRDPSRVIASQRLTKARRQKRAPRWLSKEQIEQIASFYWIAASVSEATGVKHHVDHIVPLLGKNVSGLHVPWNLQVMPGEENLKKGNSHVA